MSDLITIIDWEGAKRMPLDEFVRLAMPENRAALIAAMTHAAYMVDGIVCYQNEDGGSPFWGDRHFVSFGPGPLCQSLTVEPLLGVAYRGAGAIAYCEKEIRQT